jgi:GT2 family glycosyltransferase
MPAEPRRDRVITVVLTYNRKALLAQCLEAVARQTRPCDAIFVVDNASTDSTAAFVKEHWADKVSLFRLPVNIGAAGGFNASLRIAFQHEADFIWMMDDDVIPDDDCLEGLLAADRALKERGVSRAFLVPTAWTPEGHTTNVPEIDRRHNDLAYENWTALLDLNLVPVTRATFVGILLPRETVARHGLPIADMFMWGDDTEYTVRITKAAPGFIAGRSKVCHIRALSGSLSILTENDPVRVRYHKLHIRNLFYTAYRHHGKRAALGFIKRRLKTIAKLVRLGHGRKALLILTGLIDGFRFNPAIERAEEVQDHLRPVPLTDEPARAAEAAGRPAALPQRPA